MPTVERAHRKADSQFPAWRQSCREAKSTNWFVDKAAYENFDRSQGRGVSTCLHHLHLFSKAVRLLKQWQVQEQKHVALIRSH